MWIKDVLHPYYPNYVKILESLPDGKYRVQIQTAVLKDIDKGPIEILREDQITDDLIG